MSFTGQGGRGELDTPLYGHPISQCRAGAGEKTVNPASWPCLFLSPLLTQQSPGLGVLPVHSAAGRRVARAVRGPISSAPRGLRLPGPRSVPGAWGAAGTQVLWWDAWSSSTRARVTAPRGPCPGPAPPLPHPHNGAVLQTQCMGGGGGEFGVSFQLSRAHLCPTRQLMTHVRLRPLSVLHTTQ